MNCSRRTFMYGVIPAAATVSLAVSAAAFATPQFQSTRASQPFPGTSPIPNPRHAAPGPTPPEPADPRPMLMHNQEEIQEDIKKLYSLAEQLKKQVDKTNTADVLSLNLVDNAKKIEDLAKQIKNLAKAS